MIDFLISVLISILVGICCGIFTMFFSYCIGNPHNDEVNTRQIFSRYGVWLRHKYDELEFRIEKNAAAKAIRTMDRPDLMSERELSKHQNWYKAMGMCPICSNVYLTLIMGSISCGVLSMNFFFLFFILMFSHITVRLWMAHF